MLRIEYPAKKPLIKTENKKDIIFCVIRKRWFVLTPEEWVRQNFLLFLTEVLHYPASLIAVEKQLLLGELKRRFDIVVYKNTIPFMIVECKEMQVPISEKSLSQVMRYNINLQAPYFVITNGVECFGFERKENSFNLINKFPVF